MNSFSVTRHNTVPVKCSAAGSALRGVHPRAMPCRGPCRPCLARRRGYGTAAAAATGESSSSLASTLPELLPWAEARVSKWATGWEKAAALTPNPALPVLDLMPSASAPLPGSAPPALGPFETAFGAFIYDKGYRQLFRALGYPGPDAEAAMAIEQLTDGEGGGGVCLDVSCGPGIITARLAANLTGYDALVASDVSDAMTRRAADALDALATSAAAAAAAAVGPAGSAAADAIVPAMTFAAVRADVGEMPFADDSIAAVHCSAVGSRARGKRCLPKPTRLSSPLTAAIELPSCFRI